MNHSSTRPKELRLMAYLPVDRLKEDVRFDVFNSVGSVPEPVLRVTLEQHSQE